MTYVETTLTVAVLALFAGCGGTKSSMAMMTSPDMSTPADQITPGIRGTVIDYFSSMPLAGMTVTDGPNSTTTDAGGNWTLPTTGPLAPVVTGPMYSTLYLPQATAGSVEVNQGAIPLPNSSGIALEQNILASDSTKAIVQVTVLQASTCPSIAGGTLTVESPEGASVAYFTDQKLPTGNSFIDGTTDHRPVAVIYNLEPGVDLGVTLHVPGCTQAPPDTPFEHASLNGKVTTAAVEPGDHNSSLVLIVQ